MKNPSTVVVLIIVGTIIARQLGITTSTASTILAVSILIAFAYENVKKAESNSNVASVRIELLRGHIEEMTKSRYVKNNEEIPLRKIKRFKYIFLETEMMSLLNELFQYKKRYTDVVYSVVYYSEAFIRQIVRMMEGKVRDDQQARTLGERIINHVNTLIHFSSKYEKKHIESIQYRFRDFIWAMYAQGLEAIGRGMDAYMPSPIDVGHSEHFELYNL